MNTSRLLGALAALSLLAAGAAFASPADGIRPGVAPAPWLNPATPTDGGPAYGLTGVRRDTTARQTWSRNGFRREAKQIGKEGRVETYSR